MRYFLDTEFIDDGKTIDLISIGIVAWDGREYYAQSVEFDMTKASGWVRENVFPRLKTCHWTGKWNLDQSLYSWKRCEHPDCPWRMRDEIKQEILAFMDVKKYGMPELWGQYSAYDHVAFCQLFGAMADLPRGFPMYTRDLQQVIDEREILSFDLPNQPPSTLHNALADAQWLYDAWRAIFR